MPLKRRHQENTELPSRLLDQISGRKSETGSTMAAENDGRFKKKFKSNIRTRKQARKQAREDKKQRKNEFYKRKYGVSNNEKDDKKKEKAKSANKITNKQQPKPIDEKKNKKVDTTAEKGVDERARLAKFAKRNTGMYQLLRESNLVENVDKEAGLPTDRSLEDTEERELRRLERNLGMKTKSKLESAFYSEGLGDLLEGISHGSKSLHGDSGTRVEASDYEHNDDVAEELNDSSEEDASNRAGKSVDEESLSEDELFSDNDAFGLNNLGMEDGDSGSEVEDSDIAEMYKEQGIEMNPELVESEYESDSDSDNEGNSDGTAEDDLSDIERNVDDDKSISAATDGNKTMEPNVGRYIPPSLRKQQGDTDSEQTMAIRKVLQGQLNRLSETNIESIVTQIESLYAKYPRHHVTDVWSTILLQSIQSRSNMLDTFLYVNAALVGAVYRAVGLEPVAYLVQEMMQRFEQFFIKGMEEYRANVKSDDNGDGLTSEKQCQNLAVFVAELYNFQVVSCQLVYDVIRLCIQDINEFTAEILLKIIRVSGVQLRKDDPLALKAIVQQVSDEVGERSTRKLSVRCQFMVENLVSLKDNRMRNAMSQNADNVAKLKRLLGNMDKRRSVGTVEPINIGLQDIREVETKGKWWLVGASWVGNQYTGKSSGSKDSQTAGKSDSATSSEMERLLQAARDQHMNTDIRRSIFVTLLSSDDYADAFERLLKLNLKKTQTREVVRVLLHCCGQEQAYNPYYALVAFKLCGYHGSYAHTMQFALWDFLRELGEADVGGLGRIGQEAEESQAVPLRRIVNTAKLYAWLIAKQALSLLVLKTVTFASVRQQGRTFFQVLFSTLFLLHKKRTAQEAQALVAVFQKTTANPAMCQGLLLFFQHFVRKCDLVSEDELPVLSWGCRVAKKVFHSESAGNGVSMADY